MAGGGGGGELVLLKIAGASVELTFLDPYACSIRLIYDCAILLPNFRTNTALHQAKITKHIDIYLFNSCYLQ